MENRKWKNENGKSKMEKFYRKHKEKYRIEKYL